VFYFTRGRIRLDHSEESGRKILRFNAFERFSHWLTASCFIVLAITGLNYIFGKRLLMPLIGPDAFASFSQWGKYAHTFLSWPFMLGVLFMIVVWVRDNIPSRVDWAWLKRGGGFLGDAHPDAGRFNAGQKIVFWIVALFGIAMSVTGIIMLFPFSAADINGMQLAQYVHATIGVIFIAVMIAHIYIGSLGMEGAYDAMGSGEVDLAWARAHHSVWVEEEQARNASGPQLKGRAVPAE
jgi:formate dehydrogenase subunit gamma